MLYGKDSIYYTFFVLTTIEDRGQGGYKKRKVKTAHLKLANSLL